MVEVKFYDSIDDKFLKFAVIISKTNGKWILDVYKRQHHNMDKHDHDVPF